MTSAASLWTALLLGLAGSLGHCTGMCGGISLLLAGKPGADGRTVRLAQAHLGRLLSYAALGAAAGAVAGAAGRGAGSAEGITHSAHAAGAAGGGLGGQAAGLAATGVVGGASTHALLSLAAAAVALYFALALLGRVPSAELLLARVTRRWRGAMRASSAVGSLAGGLVWGLLPCGLVLAALLVAAAAASPAGGAAAMLAFGAGTLPAHAALTLLGRRLAGGLAVWPQRAAALVTGTFGVQLALRGLAALGLAGHFAAGPVALW